MEEYKHVADSNFKVNHSESKFPGSLFYRYDLRIHVLKCNVLIFVRLFNFVNLICKFYSYVSSIILLLYYGPYFRLHIGYITNEVTQ